MTLLSCVARRSRGRKRGRSFNATKNLVAKAAGVAICASYGRCFGRLETVSGSSGAQTSAKKFSTNFHVTQYPVQFLELVVRNQPIPALYNRNTVLPYTGMQYKHPNFTGDWVSFPSSFRVWGRRRVWRYWRWYRYEYRLCIGLVPGSTPAEATYRIFLNTFWNARYLSDRPARDFMSQSLTAARDFRGLTPFSPTSGGFTPIMGVLRGNPTAAYYRNAWHANYPLGVQRDNWQGKPGFIRLTIPELDEAVSVIYDMR